MYPKIKIKKFKFNIPINYIFFNIKKILLVSVNIIMSKDYFISFIMKNFHF